MARKPIKKSHKGHKGLGKKVLDEEGFEEFPDRPRTNGLFPVNLATNKDGGCLFEGTKLDGENFCPNAEYCHTQDDELTEFRCLMRERFIYERMLADIGTMPVYYEVRQRK
jgi:hypothetical protein